MAAYGADKFPAFFTRRSGCAAPARIDSPELAAAMIRHSARLGLGSGAVIGEGPFPHLKRLQNPPCPGKFAIVLAACSLQECRCQSTVLQQSRSGPSRAAVLPSPDEAGHAEQCSVHLQACPSRKSMLRQQPRSRKPPSRRLMRFSRRACR